MSVFEPLRQAFLSTSTPEPPTTIPATMRRARQHCIIGLIIAWICHLLIQFVAYNTEGPIEGPDGDHLAVFVIVASAMGIMQALIIILVVLEDSEIIWRYYDTMLCSCAVTIIGTVVVFVIQCLVTQRFPDYWARVFWTWLSWPVLIEITGFTMAFMVYGKEKNAAEDIEMGHEEQIVQDVGSEDQLDEGGMRESEVWDRAA